MDAAISTQNAETAVAEVIGDPAAGAVTIVCEHASNRVPAGVALGVPDEVLASHVAWDPGARDLALVMGRRLGAAVVAGRVSRLVYDCNRPPDAPSAIPARSEIYDIPGNVALSEAQRQARVAAVYAPFHAVVTRILEARSDLRALVTVHSFTPVYLGEPRAVEIGLLHGADDRLARAMLDAAGETGWTLRLNAPYGPQDGVTHMLDRHGPSRGLLSVMIEVRNDLLARPERRDAIARDLCAWLDAALPGLAP